MAPHAWNLEISELYPAADGWSPPALPSNDELLKFKQEVAALPKKTLIKRLALIRAPAMEAISKPELLEEHRYSLSCIPLAPWSAFSGEADEQGWMVWVYYQQDHEQQVLSALESRGVELANKERMAVDPDSPDEAEQLMMLLPQQSHHVSDWEHEIVAEGEDVKTQPDAEYW